MWILNIFKKMKKHNHKNSIAIADETAEVATNFTDPENNEIDSSVTEPIKVKIVTSTSEPTTVDITPTTEQKSNNKRVFFEKKIAYIFENSIEYCLYICRNSLSFTLKEVSHNGFSGETKVLNVIGLLVNDEDLYGLYRYNMLFDILSNSKFKFSHDYLGNIGFDCENKFDFELKLKTISMDTAVLNSKKNKENGYIDIEELQEFLRENRLRKELLFSFHTNDTEREYCSWDDRIYIDKTTGTPFRQVCNFYGIDIRPGSVSLGAREEISYDKLNELAKKHSVEVYNKYKGINYDNWKNFF